MIKKILVVCVIILIFFEFFLGYLFYQKSYSEPSAVFRVIKFKILPLFPLEDKTVRVTLEEENPFISNYENKVFKIHPFIDFSGVLVAEDLVGQDNIEWDYFGFRNKEDLYFDMERDYILVVITGGSEAAGYTHRKTIAENLEKILNSRSDKKFKVLNLAMDSYTVPNEINSYIHLTYNLKPEFVISHSGWNDIFNGLGVPYNFKKLGLNYMRNMEFWTTRIYKLTPYSGFRGFLFNEKGKEIIIDKYLENLEKYRTIVETNDGEFIVGIQPYNRKIMDKNLFEDYRIILDEIPSLYLELLNRTSQKEGYINFQDLEIEFEDYIHTNENSSNLTANRYADLILEKVNQKLFKLNNHTII